jgi:acetoin utilization deacetylase AcuC-like enzyme
MPTALFTSPSCLLHDNGPHHPENPGRLRAILKELEKTDYQGLERFAARPATREELLRVHDVDYVTRLFDQVPVSGNVQLDPDTALNPHSGEAALHAAGAVCDAVDAVLTGKVTNAFCAVRPPGHHAEHMKAMGFCLFSNLAIGAAHARAQHGIRRIAILDFDVHHGNGTEEWAAGQADVLFVSSHQFPHWPGSGRATDRGPLDNLVNIPLPAGSGGREFRAAMEATALPRIAAHKPDLIMLSAGFDAHQADPLADLRFSVEDFAWITTEIARLAALSCQGRIISSLEGGYDPDALAASAGAHVQALMQA